MNSYSSTKPDFIQPGFGNDWLTNMVEISLPANPSWMPQTWGWLLVGIFVALITMRYLWRCWQGWLSRAYLRQAKAELVAISSGLAAQQAHSLRQLPELLKRVALCEHSRVVVAGLSGQAWLQFLDRPFGEPRFSKGPGHVLLSLAYADQSTIDSLSEQDLNELLSLCQAWLDLPSRNNAHA